MTGGRRHRQRAACRSSRGWRTAWRPAFALCLLGQAATAAFGQSTELKPELETKLGVTDNGAGAPSGQERSDTVVTVRPTVRITADSPRLKLHALVGGDLIAYANGTQANRAFPLVLADGTGTLVDQLLFIDASTSVQAIERDPYAARSEAGSTQNREINSVFRLSPYVTWDLSPATNLYARVEEVVAHGETGSGTNERFTNADVRWSTRPLPWGGSIDYRSTDARFSSPVESTVKVDTLKANGDVAVGGEVVFGPSIGTERVTFEANQQTNTSYGAHLTWVPSERTQVAAEAEHRFFGTGWKLELRHRVPWATVALEWDRAPVTTSQSLGAASSRDRLDTFLDAILTTRNPDPAARSAVVNGLVANRGLQSSVPGAIDVRANYAQLQNSFKANAVFLGSRNVVSFGVYVLTLRRLTGDADRPVAGLPAASDSRQVGASLEFNRKLTPLLTFDLLSTWSHIAGLDDAAGEASTQQSHRVALVRALSVGTTVSIGVRHDALRTDLALVDSYVANSVFVAMKHKF